MSTNEEKIRKNQQSTQLQKIINKNIPISIKIALLQSKLQELSQKSTIEKHKLQYDNQYQNISTSFSQDQQSNYSLYQQTIQQLEDKIIHKRIIKFQINQEIENLQDDLFQVEKIVYTKMKYDQYLNKKIQEQMQQIENNNDNYQDNNNTFNLNKSIQTVSTLFKGWFN